MKNNYFYQIRSYFNNLKFRICLLNLCKYSQRIDWRIIIRGFLNATIRIINCISDTLFRNQCRNSHLKSPYSLAKSFYNYSFKIKNDNQRVINLFIIDNTGYLNSLLLHKFKSINFSIQSKAKFQFISKLMIKKEILCFQLILEQVKYNLFAK